VHKLGPARFTDREEHHGLSVDQLDFREVDCDNVVVVECLSKNVKLDAGDSSTHAKSDTSLDRKSVDPAGHRLCLSRDAYRKQDAIENSQKIGGNSGIVFSSPLVNSENLVDVVNSVKSGVLWESSAELELRFVDVQRFDAVVERRWRNPQLCRRP
jgi:hypothetical protein